MKLKKNKGKFPDLNKDGKITRADILKGRGVFKGGGRVERVLERGKKKAERIHEREEKREKKGKKVEVAGTRRVTTAAEPRMLTSKRETVKVYQKERDAINKADVKAAKIEGRQNTRPTRTKKVKPPKVKNPKPRRIFGKRRADKPRKTPIKTLVNNIKTRMANRRKGCFGNC